MSLSSRLRGHIEPKNVFKSLNDSGFDKSLGFLANRPSRKIDCSRRESWYPYDFDTRLVIRFHARIYPGRKLQNAGPLLADCKAPKVPLIILRVSQCLCRRLGRKCVNS